MAEMLGPEGTFLEVGLGDGIGHSTTDVLAHHYGWCGALVEAIPDGESLSSMLDRAHIEHVDLVSIQVGSDHCQVLPGLDLDRVAPRYLLVEVPGWEEKRERLEGELLHGRYRPALWLGDGDVLYELSRPLN